MAQVSGGSDSHRKHLGLRPTCCQGSSPGCQKGPNEGCTFLVFSFWLLSFRKGWHGLVGAQRDAEGGGETSPELQARSSFRYVAQSLTCCLKEGLGGNVATGGDPQPS